MFCFTAVIWSIIILSSFQILKLHNLIVYEANKVSLHELIFPTSFKQVSSDIRDDKYAYLELELNAHLEELTTNSMLLDYEIFRTKFVIKLSITITLRYSRLRTYFSKKIIVIFYPQIYLNHFLPGFVTKLIL